MKRLTALFLILALLVLSIPAFALELPEIEDREPPPGFGSTDESPANIDIMASATASDISPDTVLYFTVSWELEHAIYYRSRSYTWNTETLKYEEKTLPDWTCKRNCAQLIVQVKNCSNISLAVSESWKDGETDLSGWMSGTPQLKYKLNGAEAYTEYAETFLLASAAPEEYEGTGTPQTAELLFRVDTKHSVGETVDAKDLTEGVEAFGTATVTVVGLPSAESLIRDKD